MPLLLGDDEFDRVAPFGVLCDASLTVTRVGPAWARVGGVIVGRPLLDAFTVVRPSGVSDLDSLRAHQDSMLLLRLVPTGPRMRFQVVDVVEPPGVLLLGTPVVASSEELDSLGLTASDFSPIDQTPDLLLLRRGQERSLADLRTLYSELHRSSTELRATNRLLARAESQYRRLVELQPLVMYVDFLGDRPRAEFMSPHVEEWLGYPMSHWMEDPGFFFSLVHPDDHERVWTAHLRAERDGTAFDEEFRMLHADGHTLWTRAVDSVVPDEDGGASRRIGFMLDVTVAKTAELELRDTMSRLTTLLAHMQTGVLVEDANRRVVMANDTLCGLFRCADQPDSLVGLPVTAAVRHLMRPDDEPARFVRRTEELVQQRWPATNQSLELGDSRVLEFDFAPIVTDGQDLGALWMFRDATDRVQYQDALARARDEAIAASDAKTQFLASMSHEIRTPMHGVLATVDLLQTTRLDPEQRELVDVVSTSAASLVQIINDILDLSKVEAGRIELGAEAFAPADLLRGVADLLGSQARAKGLALSMYVDPAIPAALVGDPLRLRQVLVNLVGNAVKFTTQGSVALEVRLAQRRASDCVVEFEVRDTGEGIAADRLAAIFDPFVQARAGKEGTGLGLAIAERIVTVMGGQIQVASVLGEGSTFRFRVRLAEPTDGSDDPGADRPEPEPVVLLVDDSDASRRLALRLLARLGVTAHAVASGQEALDALEAGPTYGLVLMDADMPGLDGPRTTELVRASRDRHVATVPVFAIIGGDDRELLDRCRDSGMDGHVSKPVDITELRRLLDAVLGVAPR